MGWQRDGLCLVVVSLLLLLSSSHCASSQYGSTTVLFGSDGGTQLAMSDLKSAYVLLQPNVTLTMTKISAVTALIASVSTGAQDFSVYSAAMTISQALAYPNLQMFPIFCYALVPIYRLDGLGAQAPQLILTRPVLAQIYLGLITWWNDTAIQQCNPAQTMPAQRITMVIPASGVSSTTTWTTALGKFYPGFNNTIPISASPSWPKTKYYKAVTFTGPYGQGSAVMSIDGSLGYSLHSIALVLQNNVAAMVNAAGSVVQASVSSVTFAAVELGTATRQRTTSAMDLTDATGSSAWPISIMSFLLMDTSYSRSTCHVRAAVVQFWLWFYSSSIAVQLLGTRQYAPVPSIVLTQLNVQAQLSTNILCRGAIALPAASTSVRTIGAPVSVAFLSTLFAALYASQDSSVLWQVQQNPDQLLLSQFLDAEIDIAFVNPQNVDAQTMALVVQDRQYMVIPTYLSSIAYGYNPQLTSTVNIAAYAPLTIDWPTLVKIAFGCILYWNDPLILAQNTFLSALLPPFNTTQVPITKVNGCGLTVASGPLVYAFDSVFMQAVSVNPDPSVGQCLAAMSGVLGAAFYACQALPQYNFIFSPNEQVSVWGTQRGDEW